ncbi:MAG: PHP domain-containing protein [Pseudohongiella sp.]|uniref:PHP domain-containing protein n=1 Tax=Pseudohongiella sp. TaxID=1979412 RepID=UPI0034A022B7
MIDLHSHTWFSDGLLSPQDLIKRASELGINHLAITDHDSVAAHAAVSAADIPAGMRLIPGVEISTLWDNREIHIVGLFIDTADPALISLLQSQQAKRRERALDIGMKLEKAGISGLKDYLAEQPCEAVSRNHIADFLIARGHASGKQQAFSKHLGKRGRYHSNAHWCSISDAVAAINSANGIAVVAHPDRYKLNRIKLRRLLTEFTEAGGAALEVSYSNLHPDKMKNLADLCCELNMWASIGSDFHTPHTTWMDLGRVRKLPAHCEDRALWLHPRWTNTVE